jgi:PAS domain
MLPEALVSLHLELFRYWDAKRATRIMPARRDIDPCELPSAVLPHVIIIDQVDDRFRYRLVGTAVVRDLGCDFTGSLVGRYTSSPIYAAAVLAIYERVFASAHPLFTTGEHRTASGIIQSNSRLLLPLSNDGEKVNMVIFTRVARFNRGVAAGMDWFKDAPGKVYSVSDVASVEEIEKHCLDWERHCLSNNSVAFTA